MATKRILVAGSSNTDLIIRVPEIPRPGETILGGEFLSAPGGKGANQAVAAARAGGEVSFIASVGDDDYGRKAIAGYLREGINTSHVKVCRGIPSGIALINVSAGGENAITVAPGANHRLTPEDLRKAEPAFRQADILLVQLEIPYETVREAIKIAADHKLLIILNPAPAGDLPDEVLKKTDILTLGGKGAFISDPGKGIHERIPAFTARVVDTTAAGDVFNGALAVALNEDRGLPEAVRFAGAAAALSVGKAGAQPSIPSRGEIEHFLKANT
jgi:ribokinase